MSHSRFIFCAAVVVLSSLFLLIGPQPLARSLRRFPGVIVLSGTPLVAFRGTPTSHIRLFRHNADSGRIEPIVVQIDAVDNAGMVLMTHGPEAIHARDYFLDQDQILFSSDNLGRCSESNLSIPCQSSKVQIMEIHQETQPISCVMVADCASAVPVVATDPILYDARADRVSTPRYQVEYQKMQPISPFRMNFFNHMGVLQPNLFRQLKVRGDATVLGGMIQVTRTEQDFVSRLTGWNDGPLRLIRRIEARVKTVAGRYTNPGTFILDAIHTPGSIKYELLMQTDHDLSHFVHDLSMTVAGHFVSLEGATVRFSDDNPQHRVGTIEPEVISSLSSHNPDWVYVSGPPGQFIWRFGYLTALPIRRHLFLEDAGKSALILGYTMSGLQRITKGQSRYFAELFHIPGLSYEEAQALVRTQSARMMIKAKTANQPADSAKP